MEKKFDFDELIDRRNSGSLKWDVKENELPCGWRTWFPHRARA